MVRLQESGSSGSSSETRQDKNARRGSAPSFGAIVVATVSIWASHFWRCAAEADSHSVFAVANLASNNWFSAWRADSGKLIAPGVFCRFGRLSLISKNQPTVRRPSRRGTGQPQKRWRLTDATKDGGLKKAFNSFPWPETARKSPAR